MVQTHRQASSHKKLFRGFTLIELLVTVGILSFGIVTIYEALFISTDTFGYYANYLETQDWIDETIFQKSQELMRIKTLETGETSGQIVRDKKTFQWAVAVNAIDEEQSLYRIDLTLGWNQGSKEVKVLRSTYLLPPQSKAYEEHTG